MATSQLRARRYSCLYTHYTYCSSFFNTNTHTHIHPLFANPFTLRVLQHILKQHSLTLHLQRDEKVYHNPEMFDPERFAEGVAEIPTFNYMPFSTGPRNCIGQNVRALSGREQKPTRTLLYCTQPLHISSHLTSPHLT
jgi:hypothetical protein